MKGDNMAHPGGRPRKATTAKSIPETENNFFTVAEAADILGVHIHTVQARLRDGSLQGKKLGGVWRIYKDSLKDKSTT